MGDLSIRRIEPDDEAGLLAWHGLMREGCTADRTAAWWQSPDTTLTQFAHPRADKRDIALLASLGDEAIGGAEVNIVTDAPADVELTVLPDHRRRGFGTVIARAVEELLAGQASIVQTETYSSAGIAFAESRGLVVGNQEDRLLLDLPGYLTADANRYKKDSVSPPSPAPPDLGPDMAITSWIGGCPEEIVEDWAGLREQMDEDVPLGDLTRHLKHADANALRTHEERMDEQGWILVSSLAHVDDLPVGYTEIMVSRHEPDIVIQEDTLVDRGYRGRGIGRALKVANMRQLHSVPEAASARWIQTYTAANNAPMLSLNRDLGFATVDTMTALEGKVDLAS